MISKIGSGLGLLVILLGLTLPVQSVRVNVTSFGDCDVDPSESNEQLVRFSNITYECDADGFCDIVHGRYNIPTVNDNDKLVNITMWRCGEQTTGQCNENPEHFYDVLHCERFHKDFSGPWAMIAVGMAQASKCGALAGTFDLTNAQLKPEYLTNYMVHDVDFPRHRMRHIVRKVLSGTEDTILRACVEVEFTIAFI